MATHDERLELRLSAANKSLLTRAAREADVSVSEFVLRHALDHAKRNLINRSYLESVLKQRRDTALVHLEQTNVDGWVVKGTRLSPFVLALEMLEMARPAAALASFYEVPLEAVKESLLLTRLHPEDFATWRRSGEEDTEVG